MKTGVWPLWDMRSKIAVATILAKLKKFNFEAPANACGLCNRNYKADIEAMRKKVETYFDGLCMTCMDRSMTKLKDQKSDYWYHAAMDDDDWVKGCDFTHGEPTWYFSFMGRKEDLNTILKAKNKKRRRR